MGCKFGLCPLAAALVSSVFQIGTAGNVVPLSGKVNVGRELPLFLGESLRAKGLKNGVLSTHVGAIVRLKPALRAGNVVVVE